MINSFQYQKFVPAILIFLASCIPPIQGPTPDPRSFDQPDTDLYELGESLSYFEDFMYALDKTHLTYLMEEEGPYTVFAPVQASFSIFLKKYMINHLDEFPENKLADILLYHFIPGDWTLADIPPGYHATLLGERTTGNPIDIYVEKDDLFRINGLNTLDEPDLATINGYIHSINAILEMPSVYTHLSNNREFSKITEILRRDDIDQMLLDHFSDNDPVTFLAPTDEAFLNFLQTNPDWRTIHDIPSETVNDILRNHLISDMNVVLNNIKEDIVLTSDYGMEFTIHKYYPEWEILDASKKLKLANLSIRDIQAENGIIHQIDRVLSFNE